MNRLYFLLFIAIAATSIYSCSDGDSGPDPMPQPSDAFERSALLANIADNMILPAFSAYQVALAKLKETKDVFIVDPTSPNLAALRADWIAAYELWQEVSIFDIGKAEEIGLRNFTNIYPTDTEAIVENIESQDYNLILPSNYDAQGFPALDYLLYGIGTDESNRLALLSQSAYANYLSDLIDRLDELTAEVVDDWNGGYREEFVANNGSSGTASTDKIVNDFLFYYEKFLRAGKVGIPAGVFSGSSNPLLVEAPYSEIYSKRLFEKGFTAVQHFFNGVSYSGTANGIGLDDYLDAVAQQNNSTSITGDISTQWEATQNRVNLLLDNFGQQVEDDNTAMLATYDELQKAVVLLKVDMMQALNIQVDFIDADGD